MIPRKAAISLSSTAVVLCLLAGHAAAQDANQEKMAKHCRQVWSAAVQGMLDSIKRDHIVELTCGIRMVRRGEPAARDCGAALHALAKLYEARPESEIVPPDVCKN